MHIGYAIDVCRRHKICFEVSIRNTMTEMMIMLV